VQALSDRLLVEGAGLPRYDAAAAELAALLHRHAVGLLTVGPGADTAAWHALFLLLARTPEEVRREGGIARLWDAAAASGVAVQEIDYAEVLREKQGTADAIERILKAVVGGGEPHTRASLAQLTADLISDPAKAEALMRGIEEAAAGRQGGTAKLFDDLLRAVVDHAAGGTPEALEAILSRFGDMASQLSATAMAAWLDPHARQPDVHGIDPVAAVVARMSDHAVAGFVTRSVVAGQGASDRLAHAFSALAPGMDRQRQVLGLARAEAEATSLGDADGFPDLWTGVEGMLSSYTDATFVSTEYATELSNARTQPVDLEAVTDDPDDRIATWVSSVSDAALRDLDRELLIDLLTIEPDPLRWRDMAETVVAYAEDLLRSGHFDDGWRLLETALAQGAADPERQPHAAAALDMLNLDPVVNSVAAHLRTAPDGDHQRFWALCHAIGPRVIAPLAAALTTEHDARARLRLREILIGFGARGRDSVQQLMSSPNWALRRTAAHLLRVFGGAEGLDSLASLLADPEPLVRREAVHALVLNGSGEAAAILLAALTRGNPALRDAVGVEILAVHDDRASSTLCRLVQGAPTALPPNFHLDALLSLARVGTVEAVAALESTLQQRGWRTPLRNRRVRAAAARALRCIGTTAAVDGLRTAAASGPFGARRAARAELARLT
jgi:hypothetical protein